MKEPRDWTYDVSRSLVLDSENVLGATVTNLILGRIRARDLPFLTSLVTQIPDAYRSGAYLRCLMQVEALFKKNAAFSEREVCEQAARHSFNRAELLCRITNRRLAHYYVQRERLRPDLNFWLSRMEKDIHKLLGDYGRFLDKLPSLIRVTDGASATAARRRALPHLKLKMKVDAPLTAAPYLRALYHWFGFEDPTVRPLPLNRVEFVPKNWKTHRTIACEPEGVLPLQLAFDEFCKIKLHHWNIDLSDQSRNDALAKEASVTGSLATIDLSMASDTLSRETVAWLFPKPFHDYLDDVRSKGYIDGDGKLSPYAKFSSMGNGATFALETVVFAAACRALGSKAYSVYGDDIVIETELAADLITLLGFLGFSVNQDKSFTTGPFRESCGGNYLSGEDVTPFYLREVTEHRPTLCHNINGLASIATPGGELEGKLLDLIDELNLPLVPFNGDTMSGVFIDVSSAYQVKALRWHAERQVVRYKAFRPKTDRNAVAFFSRGYYLWFLRNRGKSSEGGAGNRSPWVQLALISKYLGLKGRSIARSNWDRIVPTLTFESATQEKRSERLFGWLRDTYSDPSVTSRYTTFEQKYVRKWVCWTTPAEKIPVHLYLWTESILARKA